MKAIKSDFVRGKKTRSKSFISSLASQRRIAMGGVSILVVLALGGMFRFHGSSNNSNNFERNMNIRGSGSDRDFSNSVMSLIRSTAGNMFSDYAVSEIEDQGVYEPAMVEKYVHDHRVELGYGPTDETVASEGCKIWNDPQESSIYNELHLYRQEVVKYWEAVKEYNWIEKKNITDIRPYLNQGICPHLEVDKQGRNLKDAFFSKSGQLSRTKSSGWVEPLLPPMRHPNFCMKKAGNILNIEYLVHDFAAMCRKLKPTSRIVLFDMGASPKFSGASNMWKIMNLFGQFGFKFDHIYAYEIRRFEPEEVYQLVPPHLQPAYHWINAGVNTEEGHALNPFTMLEKEFDEDDLVIVKLDIDTASSEVPWLISCSITQNCGSWWIIFTLNITCDKKKTTSGFEVGVALLKIHWNCFPDCVTEVFQHTFGSKTRILSSFRVTTN